MTTPNADYLFEASWEVCNKVGGIYVVVRSKAALLAGMYKNYILIGPYFPDKAYVEHIQCSMPAPFREIFDELSKEGINCIFGKWQIKGEPYAILIDFSNIVQMKDKLKASLWEKYGIDSLNAHWDFEEPMLWCWAVSRLLEKFKERMPEAKTVGQFHEWMAGMTLLFLKSKGVDIKTVFTTHATMLGRSMAGSGMDLYSMLDTINPTEEAYKLNVQEKFLTEKACAQNASVFTTVSEITGLEAEKILGRNPEVLVLNGLPVETFPTFEEVAVLHRESRDTMRDFLAYYFFPYYFFDLANSLSFFIIGRYEFKNKGIDMFIQALGRLNQLLKEEPESKTIIAFFWIPHMVGGIKPQLMESKDHYFAIKKAVEEHADQLKRDIVRSLVSDRELDTKELFDRDFMKNAKQKMQTFKRGGTPLLTTHDFPDEWGDAIIKAFIENGLHNREEDKVKVVEYPVYLTGSDGLLDLGYYAAMAGCHLGVFPSYYEPWGYTPLESAIYGVPAITTDLAGFGRFIKDKAGDGIIVIPRINTSWEDSVKTLTDELFKYAHLKHGDRVKQKIAARKLAETADWEFLIENYIKAHNLALER